MVTLSFKIDRGDIPKISELLHKEGIKKLEIISEDESSEQLPKELVEMLNIGIDQANQEKLMESIEVHRKARELCMK